MQKKRNSLAGGEPVGVVEAAMDGDHEDEAIAQPPEEKEEHGEEEACCKLLSAEKGHRQILAFV